MVIPSINCQSFFEAEKRIKLVESFFADLPSEVLAEEGWIHVDVSDGRFTESASWGNPDELKSLGTKLKVEAHLMVENPERLASSWFEAGVERLIVHVQAMRDPRGLLELAKRYNAEIMLALDPTQPPDGVLPYANEFELLQVLTVFPGPGGQQKQPGWIEKIKYLREVSPTATIEVDGGMDPQNARIAKEAGADILVSDHYIFGSPDPKGAYEKLRASYKNSE